MVSTMILAIYLYGYLVFLYLLWKHNFAKDMRERYEFNKLMKSRGFRQDNYNDIVGLWLVIPIIWPFLFILTMLFGVYRWLEWGYNTAVKLLVRLALKQ